MYISSEVILFSSIISCHSFNDLRKKIWKNSGCITFSVSKGNTGYLNFLLLNGSSEVIDDFVSLIPKEKEEKDHFKCHASNPSIKIGTWQLPHAYKVSTLQVCKAFLATKIYPQKLNQINPKYLNNFFMK